MVQTTPGSSRTSPGLPVSGPLGPSPAGVDFVGARVLRRVVDFVVRGREGAEVGAPPVPPHVTRATPRGLVRQPSHLLLLVHSPQQHLLLKILLPPLKADWAPTSPLRPPTLLQHGPVRVRAKDGLAALGDVASNRLQARRPQDVRRLRVDPCLPPFRRTQFFTDTMVSPSTNPCQPQLL